METRWQNGNGLLNSLLAVWLTLAASTAQLWASSSQLQCPFGEPTCHYFHLTPRPTWERGDSKGSGHTVHDTLEPRAGPVVMATWVPWVRVKMAKLKASMGRTSTALQKSWSILGFNSSWAKLLEESEVVRDSSKPCPHSPQVVFWHLFPLWKRI